MKRSRSNDGSKPLPKIPKKNENIIKDLIEFIGRPEFEKRNFLSDNPIMFNSFSKNIESISENTTDFDNNLILYMFIKNDRATLTTKFFNETKKNIIKW